MEIVILRRGREGVALLGVTILLTFLAFLAMVFVLFGRIDREISRQVVHRARARLLASSGCEYAYARLHRQPLPEDWSGWSSSNAADDWFYREPDSALPLEDSANPSFNSNLEGYTDADGNGRFNAGDAGPLTDRNVNGSYDAYSGRLRGGYASYGDFFRLKILDANSRILLNDGDGGALLILPNYQLYTWCRQLSVKLGFATSTLDDLLYNRPPGGYTSWRQVRAALENQPGAFEAVEEYVTLEAWRDPRAVAYTMSPVGYTLNTSQNFTTYPRPPVYLPGASPLVLKGAAGLQAWLGMFHLDETEAYPVPSAWWSERLRVINADADRVGVFLDTVRFDVGTYGELFFELAGAKESFFPDYDAHPSTLWRDAYRNGKVDLLMAAFNPDILWLQGGRRSYLSRDLAREGLGGAWGTDGTAPGIVSKLHYQSTLVLAYAMSGAAVLPTDLSLIPSGYFDIESHGVVEDPTTARLSFARARSVFRGMERIPARAQEDFENLLPRPAPKGTGTPTTIDSVTVHGRPGTVSGVDTFPKFDQDSYSQDGFVGESGSNLTHGYSRYAGDVRLAKKLHAARGDEVLFFPFPDDVELAALGGTADTDAFLDNLAALHPAAGPGTTYLPEMAYRQYTPSFQSIQFYRAVKVVGFGGSSDTAEDARTFSQIVTTNFDGSTTIYAGAAPLFDSNGTDPGIGVKVEHRPTSSDPWVTLTEGTDYTAEEEMDTGTITLLNPPPNGSEIRVSGEFIPSVDESGRETYAFPGGMSSLKYAWGTGTNPETGALNLDYENIPDMPIVDVGTVPEGTIAFLVPVHGQYLQGGGFDLTLSSGDRLYLLYRERDLWVTLYSAAGTFWSDSFPVPAPGADRSWRHVAVTFTDDPLDPKIRIYVDGAQLVEHDFGTFGASDPQSIRFIKNWDVEETSGGTTRRWAGVGYVDDVRVFPTAESTAAVGTLAGDAEDRFVASGTYLSPLYLLPEERDILLADWEGFVPASLGTFSDRLSVKLRLYPTSELLTEITSPGSGAATVVDLAADGGPLRIPAGTPPARAWRYEVTFDGGTAPVSDTPVFERIEILHRMPVPEVLHFEIVE